MTEISREDLKRLNAMTEAIAAEEQRKKRKKIEGDKCFVCYLDLDGFKHRVMQEPDALYASYLTHRELMLSSFFRANASVRGEGKVELLNFDKLVWPYMFSDSWFFASVDNTPDSLRQISAAAAGVMMRCLEIGFPARGGIGEGSLWWNPEAQIILGPAIVNAYSVAESLACFGVAIHRDLSPRVPDGAFTRAISAPIKPNKQSQSSQDPQYEDLRFACLNAHKTNRRWTTEHWLQRYDELARSYETQHDARAHIISRYRESAEIVKLMLHGEPVRS